MQYRQFGSTGMRLSAVGLGGLLAHYWEGESAHPPAAEKRRIYLKAAELGINLFDMGYGDEVHIPDELKGPSDTRHFSLKVGAPKAEELEKVVPIIANDGFSDRHRLRHRILYSKCSGKEGTEFCCRLESESDSAENQLPSQ